MFESQTSQRRIGRFAWVMAWVGLVVGQLHALSRHATVDGGEDLELPLTAAEIHAGVLPARRVSR